jgi:phosphoribulokinase
MNRPLMLGIVGDSASGKTTLARGVVRRLGRQGVTPLCLDDYHRYSRAERAALGITALDPQANEMELMAAQLATLRSGGSVRKPVYDHRTGTLREPELVAATSLVVAYGMLTLTPPVDPALFDLTVYLEPDAQLQAQWRLQRDVGQRGYTAAEVRKSTLANNDAAQRYVNIQRPMADMVVRFMAASANAGIDIEVVLRQPLSPLILELAATDSVQLSRNIIDSDGRRADLLRVPASATPAELTRLVNQLHERNRARFPALADPTPRPDDHGPALALVHEVVVGYLVTSDE